MFQQSVIIRYHVHGVRWTALYDLKDRGIEVYFKEDGYKEPWIEGF